MCLSIVMILFNYSFRISFHFNCIVPPYFEHKSENTSRFQQKSIVLNHTLTLLCPAIGLPEPKLVWFYNGNEIQLNKKYSFIRQNGKKFIINRVKVKYVLFFKS